MSRIIAILTGRSDPARTGLSPDQSAFLTAVTPQGGTPIRQGYPWTPNAPPERPVPLPIAAWHNARQWRAAHADAAFQAQARGHLDMLRQHAPLTIITGSCGLDILAAGWGDGEPADVIALGPVTRARPSLQGARLHTVIGQRDWLARATHGARPDHRVPCGHMGYWTCPETRALVADLLA